MAARIVKLSEGLKQRAAFELSCPDGCKDSEALRGIETNLKEVLGVIGPGCKDSEALRGIETWHRCKQRSPHRWRCKDSEAL